MYCTLVSHNFITPFFNDTRVSCNECANGFKSVSCRNYSNYSLKCVRSDDRFNHSTFFFLTSERSFNINIGNGMHKISILKNLSNKFLLFHRNKVITLFKQLMTILYETPLDNFITFYYIKKRHWNTLNSFQKIKLNNALN